MDLLTNSLLCLLATWLLLQAFISIRKGSKSSRLPPGPLGFPIFGNLFHLGEKPHNSLANLAKIHGPVMSLKLGSLITVVLTSEETAKQILQKHDLTFSNRTVIDAVRALQHHEVGLPWLPVAPLWRTLRKVCNTHLFTIQKLDSNNHLRRDKIQQLVARVRNCCTTGEAINIGQAAFDTTLNLLSNTIFSIDLVDPSSPVAQEFRKTVRGVMDEAGKPNLADFFPFLRKIDPLGVRRRMAVHFEKLLHLFGKLYDERLQSRKEQGSSASNDVLDTLLDIIEGNIEDINKTHVINSLLVIFFSHFF